jgi:hypothetical protein
LFGSGWSADVSKRLIRLTIGHIRGIMSHKNKCAIEAKLPLGRLAAAEIGLTAKFTRPHGWPLMSGSVVG